MEIDRGLLLQACNRQTAYCVPLYDTLGPDAVEYIIGHAEVTIVFASALKMRALVEPLSRAKGAVKAVIVWGDIDGIAKMVRSAASLRDICREWGMRHCYRCSVACNATGGMWFSATPLTCAAWPMAGGSAVVMVEPLDCLPPSVKREAMQF